MTTHDPQDAAGTFPDGLGFPGVPEDAPEEVDVSAARPEEAVASASEEAAAAGRLAYAVHADQLVSTRGRRASVLQPSLDEATVALIQAALRLTSSLRVPTRCAVWWSRPAPSRAPPGHLRGAQPRGHGR